MISQFMWMGTVLVSAILITVGLSASGPAADNRLEFEVQCPNGLSIRIAGTSSVRTDAFIQYCGLDYLDTE